VIDRALREEKTAAPVTIPYRLSPTAKYADHFVLSYLPKMRLLKEYVKVTPAGFVFRFKTFATVEHVLKWFKVHFKDPIPRAPPVTSSHGRPQPLQPQGQAPPQPSGYAYSGALGGDRFDGTRQSVGYERGSAGGPGFGGSCGGSGQYGGAYSGGGRR